MAASSSISATPSEAATERPHISVIAPIFREEGNVPELVSRLLKKLGEITEEFEMTKRHRFTAEFKTRLLHPNRHLGKMDVGTRANWEISAYNS